MICMHYAASSAQSMTSSVASVDPVEALRRHKIGRAASPPIDTFGETSAARPPAKGAAGLIAAAAQGPLKQSAAVVPHAIHSPSTT